MELSANNNVSVLKEAASRAAAYLVGMPNSRVATLEEDILRLQKLKTAFPEEGASPFEIIHILDGFGAPATVSSAGGRYFGFVCGGTLPAALAAAWLVSTWHQNASSHVMSPCVSFFEELALN